jgi:shikimate kinase
VAGHVLLSGLSGAGKSTVGRLLAARLDRDFVDLDDAIVQRAGVATTVSATTVSATTVSAIFESLGEAHFRDMERQALCEALEGPPWRVIAAGGGALVDDASRALALAKSTVVWLRVDPSTAALRVAASEDRPLVSGDPVEGLRHQLRARESLYAEADLTVDAELGPPDRIAAHIQAVLAVSNA